MRRLNGHLVKLALISVGLAACGFSPGPAGEGVTTGSSGGSGSSGNSSGSGNGGSGGGTLVITGVGLNGGGGDVGPGAGGMTCGVSSTPVMPEPPDILIVQDKSGSMTEQANGCCCGTGANSCTGNVNCAGATARSIIHSATSNYSSIREPEKATGPISRRLR